jgi:alkylhydroperoxidase family enzyme
LTSSQKNPIMKTNFLKMKRLRTWLLAGCVPSVILSISCSALAQELQPPASQGKLNAVVEHAPDAPRATPVTRSAMKEYLEDLKRRTPRIPLPELTEEEKKAAIEDPRSFGYEGRLRKLYLPEAMMGNYLPFSGSANPSSPATLSRLGPADPKLSLDYAFKVRLFWIAARGNNCQYCLGHQESKLLSAGMTEDEIAALDVAWELFPEKEQVAFALARRLTLEPHLISDEDIDRCRAFYSEEQILEMIGSIAGNNAINRWKEGAGIPQSSNGSGLGPRDRNALDRPSETPEHTYVTATSDKYANRRSKVVQIETGDLSLTQISPTQFRRPPLETGDVLNAKMASVDSRKPRLPIVDEATAREVLGELVQDGKVEQWHRLLANFPVAGKRLVGGILSTSESDELEPVLRVKMDWVIARQDRAWYAAALAKESLQQAGSSPEDFEALDADLSLENPRISERDRALLVVAKNLCASPIVLTDRQVEQAVELAGPRAVTQAIHYAAFRAAFDRITEAAGLSR